MQFEIEYTSGTCHLEDLKQLTREELTELFVQMRREGIVSGLDPTRYPVPKFKSLDEGWAYCQRMFSSVVAAKESQEAVMKETWAQAAANVADQTPNYVKERNKVARKSKITVDPNAIITLLVDKNPKKRTAAERFSQYIDGMTVQEYCDAVGDKFGVQDILWDSDRGWISLQTVVQELHYTHTQKLDMIMV